jgi:ATP-dependent helicase/nuclease subunit B
MPELLHDNLFKSLAPHDVLLTATQRLAEVLTSQYAQLQSAEGNVIWSKPAIFSFSSWLKQMWVQVRFEEKKLLLSQSQEYGLWRKIIQSTSSVPPETTQSLAKMASEAMRLMQAYVLPFPFVSENKFEIHHQFEHWYSEFQKICDANSWITASELSHYLQRTLEEGYLTFPQKIILLGFNEITPAHQQFLHVLQQQGTTVSHYAHEAAPFRISRVELDTVDEEIMAMARWSKQILQTVPGKKLIGCIVPKLEQRRSEVLSQFNEIFFDGYDTHLPSDLTHSNFHLNSEDTDAFDLSAPTPLLEAPLVAIALRLFELSETYISLERLGTLLRTPFIGAQPEQLARAHLYAHLRSITYEMVSINTLLEIMSKAQEPFYCPLFFKQISEARQWLEKLKDACFFPCEWVQVFSHVLRLFGWPGEGKLTEEARQIMEAFQKALKSFTGLDMILGKMHWKKAYKEFIAQISDKAFQLKKARIAPIQILGTLEAIGIPFTHVWVLGLTDDVWPPIPRMHPFVPFDIQTQFDLPHNSAKRELAFSKVLTEQFFQMAQEVIFSSAKYQGDIAQRSSRLLRHLPLIETSTLSPVIQRNEATNDLLQQLSTCDEGSPSPMSQDRFEVLQDDYGPAIASNALIKGGSYLFKLQAACPFRAFAELRLQARMPDTAQLHLNAREKGTLIHHTLEEVWRVLQTHQRLITLSREQIRQLVETAVEKSLSLFYGSHLAALNSGFTRIERKRLIRLVETWLEHTEKPRNAFRVTGIEVSQTVKLGGRQYKFKLDRVDELEDTGQKVVIDYKTGPVSREDWFGERPNEPQLPLYCITSEAVSGLLFGQIKTGQPMFRGIGEVGVDIEGVQTVSKEAWFNQQIQWKIDLENLGLQFSQGYAKVDPKEGRQTCQFCDLKMMCRVGNV